MDTHRSDHPAVDLTFRTLFSAIFLVSGAAHLMSPEQVAMRLASAHFGWLATSWASPELLVRVAGYGLLGGGVALLLGLRTRAAAALLAALLVPITVTVQLGSGEAIGPLFKNVAILGGLVHFAFNGAERWSVDAVLRRRAGADAALATAG